jgi:N,N-dimethylformamidase
LHTTTRSRAPANTLIRSEIVYYETGFGGAGFSVGSITFCGALSHRGYRNDVSTLLRNVLTGFAGPAGGARAVASIEANEHV